ncbi:ATP-binding protein [Xanthomonas citri]|uniref:ATP-binding protein n=1 Tax=Xanthomonas citri TaxID=346 RepID=UPI0001CED64B|nr:ATP-binding protein [Xanthomonas citri]AMU98787.1 ATPase [Xanthomonas citri pv. aurantifolii]AMV03693.1 ATPase [Xanthomonas citri pv. aurantifolii]EFF49425.1 capsular synthesis regulatory two-component sensor kinase and response regulator hybrid transcription regulator protein [Xanthomonas citri pv. aurantifolii str. ICPB 10535]MCC8489393.1 response regulator [Xanthomonas citri pv. fuscans]TBW93189.1 ATPase [Xanthomonas citri pv. aurantifolii]
MPQKLLARTGRYYRRILYGAATALSLSIVTAAVLFCSGIIDQYRDKQAAQLAKYSDEVQTQVDELSARLIQFGDVYEGVWNLRRNGEVPVQRYARKLAEGQGVTVTQDDVTATPFTLVSSLSGSADTDRLATALRVVRDISAASLIDARKTGVTLEGFLYTPDGSFLAASPVIKMDALRDARDHGVEDFIRKRIAGVEHLVAAIPPHTLRNDRLLWRPADASDGQTSISQLVVPMFHDGRRQFTIALSLPDRQFMRFFLREEARRPGFFLLSQDGNENLGDPLRDADEADLLAKIRAHAVQFDQVASEPVTLYRGGTFFVVQRISGPDWISVYAYSWGDVLGNLQHEFVTGALVCLLALGLMWATVIYFDLRVTKPLLNSAEKLIEAEHFSEAIIDTLPVGIGIYAPETDSVVLENGVAKRMLGHGHDSADFYRHVIRERTAEAVPGTHHSFIEVQWDIAEGQSSYIGVASSQTRFGGRPVILLGLVDINEHKANEMLLIQAKQTADEANRAKSIFLAIVSHEIRTPLHGAMGHLELLARSPLGFEQAEWVDMIRRSFDALLSLVNDLLDSTKLEANALKINPMPMSPNEVAERCARSFGASILQNDVAFYCMTDPDLDGVVEGDDQRLAQILQNLLGNAVKFTERGSIMISSRCLKQQGDTIWARFEVADTGIGIPASMQSAIFKPLAQADDSISRRFGGTGLGLFLCRNLSRLMGGRISVSSEPGKGSVFRVDLPFKRNARPLPADPRPLEGLSVDLVCQQPLWRSMLAERLSRWGATLYVAAAQPAPLHIRMFVEAAWNAADLSAVPTLGTVFVTAKSPLTPHRHENQVDVSSLSYEGLLDAMTLLTGTTPRHSERRDRGDAVETIEQDLDILVAEDDAVNRTLIKHQLAALGCRRVRVAVDGMEALNLWIERHADLVITDLGMPHLDGVGLLRKLREFDPDARVVATSASAAAEISADAEQFSDLLQKPVLLSDLRRVLRNAILARSASTGLTAVRESRSDELDALLQQAFRSEWESERQLIEQALAMQDLESLRRRMHRLQGALMALGADDLGAEVQALQQLYPGAEWTVLTERCRQLSLCVQASLG